MDRFFASRDTWDGRSVSLDVAESRHCARVMRKRVGDRIEIFDGEGRWAQGEISEASGYRVRVTIEEEGQSARRMPLLRIAVAVPKGKTMDLIVQKAVELGVDEIQPLVTEHTVVRFADGDGARKRDKWQRVAMEACKQCGQNVLPVIGPPCSWQDWLQRRGDHPGLLADLAEGAVTLKTALGELPAGAGTIDVAIGPEGDFTAAETKLALDAGLQPVSLGETTLRVETAVLFSLSVLVYELRPS